MRPHRSALPVVLGLLGAASLLSARPAGFAPGGPSMVIPEKQMTATTDFRWAITLYFYNETSQGVYTDSLTCEAQDLDPGITHAPRTRPIAINYVKRQLPALGTLDSTAMGFSYTALFEHARLIFRYYSHDQSGDRFLSADTIEMLPAGFAEQNRSASFRSDGTDIEYYYVRGLGGAGAAPTVLLIHGDQSHARYLLPLASEIAEKGYNVMAISQPGYGRSGGKPDLMGPASLHAAEAALDALKRSRGVDSTRIAVWGIDRGGTIATRLAMTRHDIVGAISTRGLYDLQAVARASKRLRETFAAEAGRDSAAWAQRSPASQPLRLAAPLLIECTTKDPLVPASQAQAFALALTSAGQPAELKDLDGAERPLPFGGARDSAYVFLERIFAR